jgi:formylglycine-generating enzyme required for sulfatase activity
MKGANRVLRGGSWNNNAQYCRVSFRFSTPPEIRRYNRGFRLVSPGS